MSQFRQRTATIDYNPQSTLNDFRHRPASGIGTTKRCHLLPKEWFTGGKLLQDSPLGTLRLALGHAEEAVLSELQFRLNAPDTLEQDGKIWTARTHNEMARHAGMSANTFKTKLDRLAARERKGNRHKKALAPEDAVIEIRHAETIDQTCWYTIQYKNLERIAIAKLQELNPSWAPKPDRSDLPFGSDRCIPQDRSDLGGSSERSNPSNPSDLPLRSERPTDLYIETSLKTSLETTTNPAGGGEFLEEKSRGTDQEQLQTSDAKPDQDKASLATGRDPVEDRSSAAPDFFTAEKILTRAEVELGETISPNIRAELLQKNTQVLLDSLERVMAERAENRVQSSPTGYFIRLVQRDYRLPQEEQVENVDKTIGKLLRQLGISAQLPKEWQERTGGIIVSDLSLEQKKEYLQHLKQPK